MDKQRKKTVGLCLLALVGVGIASWWYKKEAKKLKEQQQAIDDELDELGVSSEKLRDEISPDESDNLVKQLFIGTTFNSGWDSSFVDPEEALNSNTLIHVTQSPFFDKKGNHGQNLNFLIEIPNYTNGSYGAAKIADYIKAFKSAADYMWSSIVRFTNKPRQHLVGFIAVEYDNRNKHEEDDDDKITEILRLEPVVYERYADGEHDGLSKFYESIKTKGLSEDDEKSLEAWLRSSDTVMENMAVKDVWLGYEISFRIQTVNMGLGINFKTALECLKWMTEEMVVTREARFGGKSVEMRYENIMFHAPDQTGEWNLTYYYNVADDGKSVITDSYSY